MNTVVKNTFDVPVKTKLIKFIPTAYYTNKILRVEVYVLSKKGQGPVPRKLDNIIPGINFSYPIKKVILGINLVTENIAVIPG